MTILEIDTPEWSLPLLQPCRYKAIKGGRGSGKSHERAEALIEEHILNPHQRSVCIREVQNSLEQSVKRLLQDKIVKFNAGDYFEVQDKLIKSKKGSGIIIFKGMKDQNSESIKSLEGYDRAWFEEAQTCSQKSLDLLRPTIRKPNSELWFTWNPRFETDPIEVFFNDAQRPPDSIVLTVNYDLNPHFPEVLRKEMEYDRGRDPEKYTHVWLGWFVQRSDSKVFKNWRIEEFETPMDAILRFGADWGFSVDPTVLIRCFIIGRRLFVDYEAYQIGCEIVNTPDLFFTVPESEKWPIFADNARPETISHMKKNGFPRILPAIKGPKSVEDGIEWLKSFEIIVHPRCVHTIDELMHYSWKIDKDTDKVLPFLADKDNHLIDALRYACEGVRRAKKANVVRRQFAVNNYSEFGD
jgi:phage terminase large subunit